PQHVSAWWRHARLVLRDEGPEALLALAEAALAAGIAHPRVLAARAVALGRSGRMAEAEEAVGLGQHFAAGIVAAPPGRVSLAAFNAALVEELAAHPGRRFEREGTAATESWRVDDPLLTSSTVLPDLQALLAREIPLLLAAFEGLDRPLMTRRMAAMRLDYWAVLSDGPGHESWHMHPGGWLSGVYYPQVPREIETGTDEAGCLRFGVPNTLDSPEDAWPGRLLRPAEGLIALFPSHAPHRSFAYPRAWGGRVCVAFDLMPA
ncbi:MAG: hypothetical protein JWN66_2623, partial [Sphingomonas bacterium]|uniref:putative 2OG-Fe(II) oxygenase n=1 Tax=Sphingomonas bacterium TaxID=1895847 RepID=UPI0026328DA8